jgi:peroxiredoxin Q/BCP
MAQLCYNFDVFKKLETEIVVVGPEDKEEFREYWKKENLPFMGLPDPDQTVLKKYGQEIRIFKFGRMPAQVLIDKKGIIRYAHYGSSMSDIPSNAEIIKLIEEMKAHENKTKK